VGELMLSLLYVLIVWWFSTGLILFLDSLPARTFRWSMLGATVVTIAALVGIVSSSTRHDATGVYLGFTYGLVVWGWLEMSYLMGIVTGPWTQPCPPHVRGARRFVLAIGTSLYHELAVVAAGVGLIGLTAGAPNRTAAWTFLVLWLMRWSSKLNIYLGVPNLNEEFLPEQLTYLKSFITRRAMNWLFPVSITLSTLATAWLVNATLAAPSGSPHAIACALLATLTALGTLEHWFLVVPLEDAALWRWALSARKHAASRDSCVAPTVVIGREIRRGAQ